MNILWLKIFLDKFECLMKLNITGDVVRNVDAAPRLQNVWCLKCHIYHSISPNVFKLCTYMQHKLVSLYTNFRLSFYHRFQVIEKVLDFYGHTSYNYVIQLMFSLKRNTILQIRIRCTKVVSKLINKPNPSY